MTFRYLDPPFDFNHPAISKYPREVTGNYLLKCMGLRLGWQNFSNRRLFDFGCGVRFACTIANLDLEFESYTGIDVNADAIRWLQEHLPEPKFRFAHLDARNPAYRPGGKPINEYDALPFADEKFDAACMFSVITHQAPDEARAIFSLIRKSLVVDQLYFTALVGDAVGGYIEADPANPRHLSTFSSSLIGNILNETGWEVCRVYPPSFGQQTAYVCSPS